MREPENPYSAPLSDTQAPDEVHSIVLAGKGRRFGTLIVDYAAFLVLMIVFGIVIGLLFGEEGVNALQSIPDTLLGMFFLSLFYIFFEGIWGRTPGKFVFGTIVVSELGRKPSIGQIVGRTLCRFIPFEPLSCLTEKGWHDSIPKTLVVLATDS